MKARIKATGGIIEVIYSHTINDNGYDILWYKTSQGDYFTKEELEFITTEDDLDYWTRLEHQAAIAAMQGMCANYTEFTKDNDGTLSNTEMIVENARLIAHALVEKYKRRKRNEIQ